MVQLPYSSRFESILEKALRLSPLTREDIVFLLALDDPDRIARLFETARKLRAGFFADKIFAYGFVYFSTYCRNNCRFCSSRVSNTEKARYRKTREEIREAAVELAESGVHLIDLTMGEDPFYFGRGGGFDSLVDLAGEVREETVLPVMISPGVVPENTLRDFARAGVDWYACYQETHNRRLFEEMRPRQSYEERLDRKFLARRLGLLVEEGIMTGVGETLEDIADSIEAMRRLEAHQIRVMSFNPQNGTPMAGRRSPLRLRELLIIAVMRLVFPDRLIPASLDIDGRGYLKERLDAGANVVTSLIPPALGFAGVSQAILDIDEGNRTLVGIRPILDAAGLHLAGADEYKKWVRKERKRLRPQDHLGEARL
jgi:methylornithine synthase